MPLWLPAAECWAIPPHLVKGQMLGGPEDNSSDRSCWGENLESLGVWLSSELCGKPVCSMVTLQSHLEANFFLMLVLEVNTGLTAIILSEQNSKWPR